MKIMLSKITISIILLIVLSSSFIHANTVKTAENTKDSIKEISDEKSFEDNSFLNLIMTDPLDNKCSKIVCDDGIEEECIVKKTENEEITVNLYECDYEDGSQCIYNYEEVFSNSKSEIKIQCSNNSDPRYPGESCNYDSDCKGDYRSKCVNRICNGDTRYDCRLNKSASCTVGQFCDSNGDRTCLPQRELGQECNKAFDCLNNLVCYNNKCVETFSLEIGTNIEKQDDFSKKYLCSSNFSIDNVCSVSKYDKNSNIDENGMVACSTQNKCNYLIQNTKDGEWTPYTQECYCSLNSTNEAYCPYSTSDELTADRNKKIIELKKSLLDNNRHTLNREKGNLDDSRDNLSLKCIEFNSNSSYKNMDMCPMTTLGFDNCFDFYEDRSDLIDLKNNEIFSFKNNQDKKNIKIIIKKNSKFYLKSSNNKQAISKIEIQKYSNYKVLQKIDGKTIDNYYESKIIEYYDDTRKMIISIEFNEEVKEEVEFYLYIDDYSENSQYTTYKYDKNLETSALGSISNFDSSKPIHFIVDIRNYKYLRYNSQMENFVQKLYEVKSEMSGRYQIHSALIFNSNIKSARAVIIENKQIYSISNVKFDDYSTIYKMDENNKLDFTKENPNSVLFVEVTFNTSTEVSNYSSDIKILKPLINNYCIDSVKELSVKINANKKSNFQVIELCSNYLVNNSMKIYSNSKNVKVSLGYGNVNINSLINKEADYDLNTMPVQVAVIDKEKFLANPTYISVFYDGNSDNEIYISLIFSDDKFISFSDVGSNYYYNINSNEKVYLLYNSNDVEIKNSFIFKSIINKPTIYRAEFNQIGIYQTLYDLKNKLDFNTPIDSQIYNEDSVKTGYRIFVVSAAEANSIVSGKFMIRTTDSTVPSNTDIRMLAYDEFEFNKDILIVASKTKSKTISFNQGEKVYKFDITLLNGDSAEVYLNDETTKYKDLSKNDSNISIIKKDLNKITFKINSADDIDSYILVSSATELDTTNKIVTKDQEKVISTETNESYSTLIFKISEKTQFNYINLKSIEGKLEAIEKTLLPISNDDKSIYYTETDIINSKELNNSIEYDLLIENSTEKPFYVILRILSQSTSTTKAVNSYKVNYNSDVLISLESGKTSESLSFPKSKKTTKKFEIPTTMPNYLTLNIARNNLSSEVSCSVITNKDTEYYSFFKADEMLSNRIIENKKNGKSSILLTCDNLSPIDLNIYVTGSNVPKEYTTNLSSTSYGTFSDINSEGIDLYFRVERYLPSDIAPKANVEYYAALKEYEPSDAFISYYYYLENKDKYKKLDDSINIHLDYEVYKPHIKYSTSVIAVETNYNIFAFYDVSSYQYDSEIPTSSTTSSTTSSSSQQKDESGMPWWGVILILLAVIIVVALVLFGIKYYLKIRNSNSEVNWRTLL